MVKQISSKLAYKNRFMELYEDQVEFENGHTGLHTYVKRNNFSSVIPFTGNSFIMVRQYRYVMGEESIEFPAGSHEHDPDMDPRALAEAECVEETGYFPKKLELLGRLNTAPATFTSRFTIFLGTKLKKRKQKLDPEEVGLEVLEVSIAEFEKLLTSGKITDAPTVAAYGLAKAKRLF